MSDSAARYEPVIGLEVHVQLNTETKLFCRCAYEYGAEPNTRVCPTCLALPGALPVMNREALARGIRAALAVGAEVASRTKFDRKNYFYPDLPKGYQISQFDEPYCSGGAIVIDVPDGDGTREKSIGITRIHLEEDAGKSTHRGAEGSVVDLNRCGVPLLEIVSEPDLRSPEEAYRYLTALKLVLRYIDVSDCDMEKGSLRCDANVSLRPVGREAFGTKVEIKNVNSFGNIRRALEYEIERQAAALDAGETIDQETRLFDATTGETRTMRSKEQAHDYRYFPEPDLPPITIGEDQVHAARDALPELPRAKVDRLAEEHAIPRYDAWVLAEHPAIADYFEAAARAVDDRKLAANWVTNDVKRVLNERGETIDAFPIPADRLAGLITLQAKGAVSSTQAKEVFQGMLETGDDAETVAKARGLEQLSDESALTDAVREAMAANPKAVEDIKNGIAKAKGAIVGRVMKATKGKANPGLVQQLIDQLVAEA